MTEHKRRTRLAVLVMLVTPLFFSTNLIFGRLVVPEVAPFMLALIRWSAVALALSPFLLRDWRTALAIWRESAGLILLLGFLGMWICGAGVYVALGYTTATNGTLIYTSSSVLIILLEAAFFGRAIGWREAAGSAIAFLGIAAIVLRGDIGAIASFRFNVGDLIFVAAAVSWAAYSILYRTPRLARLSNMALFAMVAAAGALLNLPFAAWELFSGQPLPSTRTAWGGTAGIVLFASLLAFSGFQFGARTLGPSLTGIFMYLMPPFGVGMAVLFLGEVFQPFHAAGIALVMGGVVLATFPAGWFGGRG